jgi:NADP-dependent 3-hydroxy acid dehydrogenase YdfG
MSYFSQKVCFITGGASGFGEALSTRLAELGAKVIIAGRNLAKAENLAQRLGAQAISLDVTDRAQVYECVRRAAVDYGSLDIMINNAGVLAHGELARFDECDWRQVFEVNFFGLVHGSLAAFEVMKRQQSGHIVNIASVAGIVPTPLLAPYRASKAAVVAFSSDLREEAKLKGIKVSAICPGNIRTAMTSSRHTSRLTPPIPALQAADKTIQAIARGCSISVFPLYARVQWWVSRLYPSALASFNRVILERHAARQLSK